MAHPLKKLAVQELLQRRQNASKREHWLDQCRNNFTDFNRFVFQLLNPNAPFFDGWHIDCMAEHVQAVMVGQIKTLIINVPPREWKSGMISVAAPAFLLGRNPSEKVLCSSYESGLATSLSVQCRRVIESDAYAEMFPETILAPDQNEKTKYETTRRGMRMAASVGGSVTGFGGDWKIVDDPHDPRRANSAAELKNAIDWYRETWSSRYNDPTKVREIIIMQRLAQNDLTGHVKNTNPNAVVLKLSREAADRTTIVFPLSKKVWVREKDDVLNAERYPGDTLAEMKIALGEYGYAAQQQQEPVPRGGDRIKDEWFPRYKALQSQYEQVVMSIDTASKAREINNPSGCLTFGRVGKVWHIIDYWMDRKTYPALLKQVVTLAEKHNPTSIIIEDKSTGTTIIQAFTDRETQLPRLPVKGFDPSGKGDKVERMDNVTNFLEAGYVLLPAAELQLPWLSKLTRDLFSFPNPEFWEPIDCLSQFLHVEFRNKVFKNFNFSISTQTKEAPH